MHTAVGWMAAVVALLGVVPIEVAAAAQAEPADRQAQIRAGTCEAVDAGEVVAALAAVSAPAGDSAGPAAATRAQSSYTEVPLGLPALLASDHAITVSSDPDDPEATVACGEIGGPRDAQGALAIGLRPVGDSGIAGIAYLAPTPGAAAQTGVSLFVAETAEARPDDEESATGAGVETPTPAPAQSAGEQEYAVTVRQHVTLLVGSLRRVDALFDEPQTGEAAWTSELTAELALWQILYEEARETAPPAELAEFHERYLAALELLDSAADDIVFALENADEARLADAADKIQRAIEAIQALAGDDAATPAA